MQLDAWYEREPEWMDDALCRVLRLPQSMFFAEDRKDEKHLPGIAVCLRCPVQEQCLDFALETRCKEGIFGGKTSHQRDRLRRANRTLGL